MRPVSDEFLDIVRGSHRLAVRVRVLDTFQTGVDPTGGVELDVVDGDVQLDATAAVRGTVDVTVNLTGYDFTRDPTALLTPYGNELFVERGVVFSSGVRELVSQGYYRIYEVEQPRRPGEPLRLAGRDRMSGIVDARLTAPVQFLGGTSLRTVFETLVLEVYPGATIVYDFDPDADTVGGTTIAEEDRYGFLRELADSRGKVLLWNHRGELAVQDPPDPTDPVFDVNAGADGVLVTLDRTLHRDRVYNAVVALGETPTDDSPPVRAVVVDNDPASPTYWEGRFGKVPRFFFSQFLRSHSQAVTAATGLLRRALGLPYRVDLTAVPNPALEPLDPVRVTHRDGFETHVLETLTIPLAVDRPLVATTRERPVTELLEEEEEA